MGTSNVRILKCYDQALLLDLQTICLPGDKPVKDGVFWVVRDKHATPLGFVCLQVEMPYGYIARVGVIPAARGRRLQRKMQFLAERQARIWGCTHMVSDTANWNHPSSNTFIGMGYKLYTPTVKWGWDDGLYWIKKL